MDESESKADSDGNTSQNGGATPQNIVKPKRRSLVERELETNLTARVTSPVASGEAKGTTSRYGRSRRLKTHSEFCESDKAVTAMFKSSMNEQTPSKSPAYKMNASNSKRESPKTPIMETTSNIEHQIENIMSNNATLSRFSTAESNDKSPTKKFSKIYTRKDLIQSKEKEETVSIMKNMFSPTKSSYKASTNTHLSNILERSSEKYNLNVTETKPNGYKDTLSVVKTLDFDTGKKKKPQESAANNTISKSELFEREAKSEYQVGDLAWSRVGTYPFWPCIITRDPFSGIFVKKKLFGRVERDVFHVTFFGDNGRRGWIVDNMLRRYQGLEEFEATRDGFTPQSKKKDPRLYSAFFVSDKKRHSWDVSVQEAEILMREPKRFRIDALNEMLSKTRVMKTTPKRQRSEKIVRTDSDVSLSESLYDTLFSEDDTKGEELDKSKNKPRKKSLDVSDVVTACLDNMAAKTGISKIQKQSHMDRWLQKAKSKTPEKIQNVFGPTKSRNELKGSHSGKRSRKTPLKDQRTLILKNKCGGNDSDCLGMLRITTAFQLNDHDYTKLDTENANPENNQNRNTQDNNIIIVNGVVTDKSCGIGIISKVESLYNRRMSEDKTTETFDIENNMTVAGEELIVTETDETTVRTDDKGLKVSDHKTDAQEQISDNIQNIMDVDFQDISIKNQDKMDVDTPESVEDNSQKDLVNAEGPQTSEKTMRSNNEGLQNRESPSYRVTRRSKRLSLDPKTKIKSSEVTDGKINGDISFENKTNENNKNMKSSKSLEKSASKKNKNIINVGDKPSENEIQEKTKDNLSKYDIEIKLESRTNSDYITNGVRDNLSGSSCHTNKGDLLDDKYVNLTRNDSKTIEKSTKNDSFTKVANIAVSSDVSKILEDFSEMDDDGQLGDVRVTLPEPMPVNGDINHVHIEKVTTKDEVIENSDQNSPIEVNKPLNREDIMDRNGDVNHDEESTELVADTTQSLTVKKSPKLVLSNGDLETDAESLHDKSIKCTDIKDVEDVGLEQQISNESPEIELTPLEEIFAAQLEEAKQNNRKSKNSQEIKKDYVLHSNTLIHEALDINEINCDVKKPLETEDVQNLDKEHSEPMEVNDDAPESAIESDETARDALDDVENSSEPESPMYEETLLVEEPNNIEIVCNSGSIEQTNHKNNTEIGQDKNMSASSEPRTYSYDDKLVTLKEFKVKVTRMPMESFQNNLVSLKEKESFQQNPVKPTEKEPLQENLAERTEKAESQKNLEKPLEGRPLQKNLAEVAEKVPLQNNFDGVIEKETLDKNSDEASKRETLQQNSEEDTKLDKNIGTVNDIPPKNGELLEKETILSNLEKTTQLTATSDQKSDTVEETVVKSECGSTDSDFEDNISIAAMCRSYSEESRESKSAQNSTKECAKPKRKPSKDKNTTQPRMEMHQALENPEFLKYIELRQDALIDENPHVTEDEVVEYLFKTWLYSENLKSETVKSFDKEQSTLVKGLGDEPPPQPKKIRKKIKVEKEKEKEPQSTEEIVPKDRSKRKVARAYYNENDTDLEEELQVFEIFKMVNKQPAKPKGENAESPNTDAISMEEEKEKPEPDNYIVDEVELFFSQLAKPKPNVFKGIPRERLCEICERPGSLIKCKGLCGGMFHMDCVRREIEAPPKTDGPNRTRKRKKPRGRKPKNLDDSGSQSDDKKDLNLSDETIADEIQLENNLVIDADNFESQLEAKMQEMLKTELPADYDYSSEEELQWNDTATGKCEIVEVKLKLKRPENEYGEFKCNGCLKNEIPVCFVCKSTTSPKNSVELRQKCQTAHCHKYYHLECLDVWPQTQFSGGEPSRNNKKISETFEALTCPRHVCHTCVCDDPRGCNTRFSGDKLARCVRCPATYHSFNKCLPAGSTILSASHIVCPRHYEHRPGKIPCHVNTGWCFICALGGTLICCEYCPTSFHAECLNIKPPEGNYMCEDCETGRLPLYGEMMWVKLGHYRWWPGIILHPCEIPANIMAVRHSSGEFVVRFFGQYDHYWVNRGRVFPFLEGDSGKLSGQKSKIDEAFTMAMEHAQRACEILKNAAPNEEEDTDIASSLLPPHYVKLKVNKPCGALVNYKLDDEENSLTLCECDPNDIEPCGPDTHCLNRMLLTECGPTCRAGDRCRNRAFEMRAYPKLTHYRTSWGGWGLKTLEPIRQGQFVIEYVGELLDEAEFRRRMQRKHETRDENYYFLTLDRDRMIDAGPKGNLARFMNHCCEPNCETQKWTVLGDVRVGLFALRDIPANSEVTFNYNLECAGIEKKPCLCGAKRCSGYIGAKPKQEEAQPKKSKLHTKRPYKKRKPNVENSPSTSKTKVVKPRMTQRSRPKEVKELTEIEKDLLIIKNATNGLSSDSETCARLSSVDTEKFVKDVSKPLKRKRVSFSKDEVVLCNGDIEHSPSAKKVKLETLSGVGD